LRQLEAQQPASGADTSPALAAQIGHIKATLEVLRNDLRTLDEPSINNGRRRPTDTRPLAQSPSDDPSTSETSFLSSEGTTMPSINPYGEISDDAEAPGSPSEEPVALSDIPSRPSVRPEDLSKKVTYSDDPSKQAITVDEPTKQVDKLSKQVDLPEQTGAVPPPVDPTPSDDSAAPVRWSPTMLAAMGFFGMLLLFGLIWVGWEVMGSWESSTPTAVPIPTPTFVVQTSTPRETTPSPAVTPSPASTATPSDLKAASYTQGIAAYAGQDWEQAAASFQSIFDTDPNYLDVREKLGSSYFNWGIQLRDSRDVKLALEKFRQARSINSADAQAQAQEQRLTLYVAALDARLGDDWKTCAEKLEELRAIQADFLDSTELLYEALMNYGEALQRENKPAEALRIYRKAAALPIGDRSAAEGRVAELAAAVEPAVFGGVVYDRPTDAAVQCGSSFDSKVWGVVKDKNGRPIYRATVRVRSADGRHSYARQTNNQGGFEVPGLGCTTWRVSVTAVPGVANVRSEVKSVELNGGRFSGAGIEFRQR
jgi:tetratricopeptide (TPR) repeat protein